MLMKLNGWAQCDDLPLTKEFRMDMARFEIPVSGWTCLSTVDDASVMIPFESNG